MPRKRVDKEKRTVYSNRVVGVHRSLLDCLERRKHARDKTENHEKIVAAAYEEFLKYGFTMSEDKLLYMRRKTVELTENLLKGQ